jgi:S-phase kinase-associated protein 1
VNAPTPVPRPIASNDLARIAGGWDARFINVDLDFLGEIIVAANYLDIKELLELGCVKIASMIKGKDADEVRAAFDIQEEFTEEEKAYINEEKKWCEGA